MSIENENIPEEKLKALFQSLNGVLLRNFGYIENLKRGGDVDICVKNIREAREALVRELGTPVKVASRSYVSGYYWVWGYIDLFPDVEWRGAEFLPKQVLFNQAIRDNGIQVAHPAHEALICWFSSLLWGGFFKDRYKNVIISAAKEYPEEFLEALQQAVGQHWAQRLFLAARNGEPEVSKTWVKVLRFQVWWRAFWKSPWGTLRKWLLFLWYEFRLRLDPPVLWAAVLGLDGSGKTSLINGIEEIVKNGRVFTGIKIYHWSPAVLFPKKGAAPVTDPHGKSPRSFIFSLLKLACLVGDWWIGYFYRIVHLRAKGILVFFDRYYHDLLVDPKRYRYGGPMGLARWLARFIPKPDLFLFLDLPAEVAHARKPEIPLDEARTLRQRYLELARALPNAHVLDASLPPAEVADAAEKVILAYLRSRTRKRLGMD